MITTNLSYTADLDRGIQKEPLHVAFVMGDQEAHRFIVHVCRRSSKDVVDLSMAGVQGYFFRSDGATVVIPGETEDSRAVVTLPAACYAVPGRFSLVVKISLGDTVHTVLYMDGTVSRTQSDIVIDPGDVVPSLDALLAKITELEIVTEAAQEIVERSEAADGSAAVSAKAAQSAANRATAAAETAETAEGNVRAAEESARAAAQNAAASEDEAKAAADQSSTSELKAREHAQDASVAAGNAAVSESGAKASAEAAEDSAEKAESAADRSEKAEETVTKAVADVPELVETARNSSQEAATSANEAKAAASQASGYSSMAGAYSADAQEYAQNAITSSGNAATAAQQAIEAARQAEEILTQFPAVDDTLTQKGAPADAAAVGEKIGQQTEDITSSNIRAMLLSDAIPNTVQAYGFTDDGVIAKVQHTRDGQAVRTDTFFFEEDFATETRTLATGENLTITTNLETLETIVSYAE